MLLLLAREQTDDFPGLSAVTAYHQDFSNSQLSPPVEGILFLIIAIHKWYAIYLIFSAKSRQRVASTKGRQLFN